MVQNKFITGAILIIIASLTCGVWFATEYLFNTVLAYERVTPLADLGTNTATPTPRSTQSKDSTPIASTPTKQEKESSFQATDIAETEVTKKETPQNLQKQTGKTTEKKLDSSDASVVPTVPFYSQLTDITSAQWKKVGCGITSLAMLIEFYKQGEVTSVDTLLQEGIDAGAYIHDIGWSYAGLIGISNNHGLQGKTHDYGGSSVDIAFEAFEADLKKGPLMASVHYTFEPTNPIPHLVIINGIKDGEVYYNDPAAKNGGGSISIDKFKKSWKKRYLEFRPTA